MNFLWPRSLFELWREASISGILIWSELYCTATVLAENHSIAKLKYTRQKSVNHQNLYCGPSIVLRTIQLIKRWNWNDDMNIWKLKAKTAR